MGAGDDQLDGLWGRPTEPRTPSAAATKPPAPSVSEAPPTLLGNDTPGQRSPGEASSGQRSPGEASSGQRSPGEASSGHGPWGQEQPGRQMRDEEPLGGGRWYATGPSPAPERLPSAPSPIWFAPTSDAETSRHAIRHAIRPGQAFAPDTGSDGNPPARATSRWKVPALVGACVAVFLLAGAVALLHHGPGPGTIVSAPAPTAVDTPSDAAPETLSTSDPSPSVSSGSGGEAGRCR